MNNQPGQTQKQVKDQAEATFQEFIIDSVNSFADEHDIYDAIRAFKQLRADSANLKILSKQEDREHLGSSMDSLQMLLIEIAEGRARKNEMVLESYVQVQE